MQKSLFAAIALVTLGACAAAPISARSENGSVGGTGARIGRTINIGGPLVTPLAVLEDSRCPTGAQCFWAGRVRLRVRVMLNGGSEEHELQTGTALNIANGELTLHNVYPAIPASGSIKPQDYRFDLRFVRPVASGSHINRLS